MLQTAKTVAEFETEASKLELLQTKQKQKVNAYKDGVLLIREIARGLVESVDVLNSWYQLSKHALIVVTQHYDTLQAIGAETNSNLILLPNSPQAGSEMLNNMVASFTASNMVGESMKGNKGEN
jgi:regulator of protease activity HflC (stomatin/prohibitin superfamily)